MEQLNRILVANDRLEGLDGALEKAAVIEHYTGAEIQVITLVYDAVAEEAETRLPAEQRIQLIEALKAAERNGLRTLAEPFRARVATLETQVLWEKHAAQAVLRAARQLDAELLIKPASRRRGVADFLHTPLDWALMREAHCPVLVTKSAQWEPPHRVLAAVDVGDVDHLALNRRILTTAAGTAAILGAPLHVVSAYPSLGQNVNELQVAMDYEGIKADMRASRQAALDALLAELDIRAERTHLLEGRPADVVPALANRERMTVTVLGTAARRGLAKWLIGNTAEDIVGRIDGDLLTVREAEDAAG